MSSNEPVKNGCEVTYEMFQILNCRFEIKSYDHRSNERNFAMIIAHLISNPQFNI